MKRRLLIAALLLAVGGALGTVVSARVNPIARFSARVVEMASPARVSFRAVEIVIDRWSTNLDQRRLARTLLGQGPVAFADALCGFPSMGSIVIAGHREFTIRYAWHSADRDGGQRIYLATDEPISLGPEFRRFPDAEVLTFVELRLDRRGEGIGKLSDTLRLSVDESRNVIELRDFDRRPTQFVMVHDESVQE